MNFIVIEQTIGENVFYLGGHDTPAGVDRFLVVLKARWRERAKREWGEKVGLVAKVTLAPASGYCPDLEIWGENAAGDFEDLSWQRQGYEDDILELIKEFDLWAVPIHGEMK